MDRHADRPAAERSEVDATIALLPLFFLPIRFDRLTRLAPIDYPVKLLLHDSRDG